jgi:DNA-binding LytR/AlgR family response regulator
MIVDDELMAHQILEHYILQTPGLTLLAKCRNALEAFAMLERHTIDLIFLDIEMPLVNGLSFLKTLPERPAVILTTAYAEYALEGYELDVIDYLLKPFSLERFTKAVRKFNKQTPAPSAPASTAPPPGSPATGHLLVREKNGLTKLPFEKIIWIEASRDYMKIITVEQQHLVHITMKQLEEELPKELFVRVHKSYIVALSQIRIIRTDSLLLMNNTEIPVSANYKDKLQEVFRK